MQREARGLLDMIPADVQTPVDKDDLRITASLGAPTFVAWKFVVGCNPGRYRETVSTRHGSDRDGKDMIVGKPFYRFSVF